jgi:hypothetical protein
MSIGVLVTNDAPLHVMPAPVAGIHVLLAPTAGKKDVDARHKPGHDDSLNALPGQELRVMSLAAGRTPCRDP